MHLRRGTAGSASQIPSMSHLRAVLRNMKHASQLLSGDGVGFLFDLATGMGSTWPEAPVPPREQRQEAFLRVVWAQGRAAWHSVLVFSEKEYYPNSATVQLSFDLMDSASSNIIRLAPPHRDVYLDYGLVDIFRGVPSAKRAARKLERQGLSVIGQLIQKTEREISSIVGEVAAETMREHLAKIELGFDMRAPRWSKANRRPYGARGYWHNPSLS